ncbi:E3 ubiquitin-protein ligase RNF169-like [Bacillus rossius redtenbacheri]|uniref:E3 ubiquitin-protein ligase RNF169-like n=1 Tax=Bacillus rossius redtenbacheri TaxID=93214 RepID=UPI002FDD34AB
MSKLSRNEAASLHSKMLREMTLLDVMCPVCRGILIEPVTMPCYHCLCKLCFERTMEEASLSCPMCRKRIGGWFRKNSKTGKLIDSKLWKEIKTQFPHQVGAKLKGEDDGIPEDVLTQFAPQQQLCDTGEIRREYELDLKKLQDEERRRQEEEESKSAALIEQLQEEEMQLRLRLKQAEMDERLARQLQDEASQSPGQPEPRDGDKENNVHPSGTGAMPAPNKGPMDAFLTLKKAAGSSRCLSPADLNGKARPPAAGVGGKPRCASDASTDSIHQEMHHFKPIRAVPRTPPKRMPDGRVVEPKLIKSIPRNLNEVYDEMSVPGKSVVPAAGLGHCVDLSSPSSSADTGAAPSAFAGKCPSPCCVHDPALDCNDTALLVP